MQTRREFLLSSAALTLALQQKADAAPDGAPGEWRNKQSGVSYRRLGRTGYMISEVVMGGNTISPTNYQHVLLAMDMGLNYLDTAPAYGNTQSELGYAKVIAARPRESFFLNTKVSVFDLNRAKLYRAIYDSLSAAEQKRIDTAVRDRLEETGAFRPDYIVDYWATQRKEVEDATLCDVMAKDYGSRIDRRANYRQLILDSVDASLKRLGTDYVDLLMCPHGVSTEFELRGHPEIFEAFEVLKKSGKARHFGFSSHNAPSAAIHAALDAKVYSAAMVAYNVVNDGYVAPALERAHNEDFGIVAMKVARPVHPGSGRQQAKPERVAKLDRAFPGELKVPQRAYLWALRNPNVSAVISELVNADLVRDNLPLAKPKAA
jgi:aryl-alcohol dehydrogenase-like predicted oxidoreductase